MELTFIDYFNGLSSLLFVIISFIIGFKLIFKYFKYQAKELGLVGLTWLGICEIWIPTAISFITVLLFNFTLSPEVYFFIAFVFVPIAIIFWLLAFTDLLYQNQQKKILFIYIIYGAIFEVVFIFFLCTDSSMIGKRVRLIEASYTLWMYIYLVSIATTFFLTAFLFAKKSLLSENRETKIKAKFLIAAVITLFITSLLDAFFTYGLLTFILYKIFLISCALEFYFSFFLPTKLRNFLV
ncbi:MAG: hypothetical protein ACFFAO_11735 [Candidatus Hermodarchaeota archaeon]